MAAYLDSTGVTNLTADIKALTDAAYIPKKASISVPYTSWAGSGPYTQTVTISGATVTANTKVDVQPDATVCAQMLADSSSILFIENNNGTLTLNSIGAALTATVTIQVIYYETN